MIFGLHPVDFVIVLISLFIMIGIGAWIGRRIKKQEDFFVGGRKLGSIFQFFMFFGNATDPNGAPMIASEVYRQGAAGMWVSFQPLFAMPFVWFTCIWSRRHRLMTNSEVMVERFNSRKLAVALSVWGIVLSPFGMALGNLTTYKVASSMIVKPVEKYTETDKQRMALYEEFSALRKAEKAGPLSAPRKARLEQLNAINAEKELTSYISYLEPVSFLIVYNVLVLLIIFSGGTVAAAYADIFQGILILAFSIVLVTVGLAHVGGFTGLHQKIPEYMFRIFGTEAMEDYTWYSIAAFLFMGLTLFFTVNGCGTATNEKAARLGYVTGAFAKRFVMLTWLLCGLLAFAIFQHDLTDPDNAWGQLSKNLLPVGLLGIMISGMLIGHMPSVAGGLVNFSAGFTRNLYEPLFRGRSQAHYMLVARLSMILVTVLGILCTFMFSGIIQLFITFLSIGAFFGGMGLLAFFWRGLTARAIGWGWLLWMVFLIGIAWTVPYIQSACTSKALTAMTLPRTVTAVVPATEADVAAGKAAKVGQVIKSSVVMPQRAIYFEKVVTIPVLNGNGTAPVLNGNGTAPVRSGKGRFHVELYLLHLLGVPVESWNMAALNTSRYLMDSIAPIVLLVLLSLLLPDRRRKARTAEESQLTHSPGEFATMVMHGNVMGLYNPDETEEQAQLRVARFYAKQKTPIGASPEEDEKELALTFANPSRFDGERMFPAWTGLEFTRWERWDYIGFFGLWVLVCCFLWILVRVLMIGS